MLKFVNISKKNPEKKSSDLRKKDFKEICSTLCEKLTSINIRLKEFEKKDES